MRRFRFLIYLACLAIVLSLAVLLLERSVLYIPQPYEATEVAEFEAAGGERLDYTTSEGAQTAWLIRPASGGSPVKLWVCCGGNGMRALDLADFVREAGLEEDAFVLVDYPGYGECAGSASPAGIRENVKQSVLSAAAALSIEPAEIPERVCVYGQSLGCAASLLAVEEFHLCKAVLSAPFTSTTEMAWAKLKVPTFFPLRHPFDNRVGLAEIARNQGHAWLVHGDQDAIIPMSMSQTLADEAPEVVTFTKVAGAGHNDLLYHGRREIYSAMREAR